MADELNTPGHRWYQRRYNIPLANEDFSKQWIFDSGIQKIDAYIALLGGVSAYAINSYEPSFVTDFGAEFYRKSGATSTFSDSITHYAPSNGTMVDSDGLLKWRPHNLLTYSEQFDNALWNAPAGSITPDVSATTAPNGSNTADKFTPATGSLVYFRQVPAAQTAITATQSIYAKAAGKDVVWGYMQSVASNGIVYFDLSDQTTQIVAGSSLTPSNATIESVGDGWYRLSFTVVGVSFNGTASGNGFGVSDAKGSSIVTGDGTSGIYVWGAHLYRSDLGGMVNNPDRGDSYVPTTSQAVYLPRRGHHVYNGDSWVNKGLLHESEARTNLLLRSEEFANAYWSVLNATRTSGFLSPTGELTAFKLTSNGVNPFDQLYSSSFSIAANVTYTASLFIKAGDSTLSLVNFYADPSRSGSVVILWSGGVPSLDSVTQSAATVSNVNFQDVGSGWWRFSFSYLTTATANHTITIQPDRNASGAFIYIYGAQLEAGSTPSSYIPTSGATVTRSAETLTVPAANLPWPSPVVIGEELVTNGTFDTDLTGWTTGNTTVVDNAAKISDATGVLRQVLATEAGKVYAVNFDLVDTTNGDSRLSIDKNDYASDIADILLQSYPAGSSLTFYFVAQSTTTYFGFRSRVNGQYITVDNISVKEINPLSVSIQMQGEMTYADTGEAVLSDGVSGTVIPVSWVDDASNFISSVITTAGTEEGNVAFLQEAGGNFDFVKTTGDPYSPGILQPFNIASRHGSTFINGAVDGTALTVNPTPTALPDLSATDLQLGYDYMGTISLFRVWADDLTDAGIADASAPSTVPSLSLTFDGASTSFTDTGMTV